MSVSKSEKGFPERSMFTEESVCFLLVRLACNSAEGSWGRSGQGLLSLLSSPTFFVGSFLKSIYFPFGQDDMKGSRDVCIKERKEFPERSMFTEESICFLLVRLCAIAEGSWGRSGQGLLSLLSSP
ncbi:hypothetical protein CEXT_35031 [Caerostris extrusa]|uniref:Uncharacterized protein n=1 Tax=Caerostris extrusa TaxID=172846 RepID=A0AAV4VGM1_CAEEX|nr:hypothetical protein CEXT_35031 [Caerostris extrusa]